MTETPSIDYELELIREGAAALGRIAARAEAAAQIHRRAYYDAAHGELKWAGLCNCDDDEPEEKAPLTRDEVNQRIKDAFSQLSKAAQPWLRPNPRPADPGGRAAEANQDGDSEATGRCRHCGDPGEHICVLALAVGHPSREADDLDQASTKPTAENRCAHCGDVIHLIDGAWKHRPGLRSPHDPEPANLASH